MHPLTYVALYTHTNYQSTLTTLTYYSFPDTKDGVLMAAYGQRVPIR